MACLLGGQLVAGSYQPVGERIRPPADERQGKAQRNDDATLEADLAEQGKEECGHHFEPCNPQRIVTCCASTEGEIIPDRAPLLTGRRSAFRGITFLQRRREQPKPPPQP